MLNYFIINLHQVTHLFKGNNMTVNNNILVIIIHLFRYQFCKYDSMLHCLYCSKALHYACMEV